MRREVYPTSEHYRERMADRLLWMAYWLGSRTSRQARRAQWHLGLVLAALVLTLRVVARRWRLRAAVRLQVIRRPVVGAVGTVTHLLPWRE